MHPKTNNSGYLLNAETLAYQGSALSAGVASAGSAVALNLRGSFVLVCAIAGSAGTPTSGTVTLAVQAAPSTTSGDFVAVDDRDGNPVTLAVTLTDGIGSVNVDTQYFPAGSTHVRVVPTVALSGGSSPTVSFTASLVTESWDHL
jgi:hypothetical protein